MGLSAKALSKLRAILLRNKSYSQTGWKAAHGSKVHKVIKSPGLFTRGIVARHNNFSQGAVSPRPRRLTMLGKRIPDNFRTLFPKETEVMRFRTKSNLREFASKNKRELTTYGIAGGVIGGGIAGSLAVHKKNKQFNQRKANVINKLIKEKLML